MRRLLSLITVQTPRRILSVSHKPETSTSFKNRGENGRHPNALTSAIIISVGGIFAATTWTPVTMEVETTRYEMIHEWNQQHGADAWVS